MRLIKVMLWTVVLTSIAMAQASTAHKSASGIAVIETGWVYASTDSRSEAEAATTRGEWVGTGSGIAPTSVRTFPEIWEASVSVKNVGQKMIKAISLELVFVDAVTKREILRYQLSRENDFSTGETATLTKRVNDPMKGYYYVPGTNKKQVIPRTSAAKRQVVVTRVEYADGTVWRL